jgi:signal recognition particle GTPase
MRLSWSLADVATAFPLGIVTRQHDRQHSATSSTLLALVPSTRFTKTTTLPTMRPRFTTSSSSSTTARYMVFDFFKQRTQEGLQQLNNLASASYQGQLTQGLQNAIEYTQQTNAKFYSGLASSRTQLLQNLNKLFDSMGLAGMIHLSGMNQMDEWLEQFQNVLLQADLGMSTSEDILQEVKSFLVSSQEDPQGNKASLSSSSSSSSSSSLTQDDLLTILRGKLVESLDTGHDSRRITFSEDSQQIPTVLFIMGANGMGK